MCLPAISGSQKLRSRRTANPAIRVADVADRCGRATDMSTCIQLVGEESNSRTGGMGITVHLRWELVSKPTMRAAAKGKNIRGHRQWRSFSCSLPASPGAHSSSGSSGRLSLAYSTLPQFCSLPAESPVAGSRC